MTRLKKFFQALKTHVLCPHVRHTYAHDGLELSKPILFTAANFDSVRFLKLLQTFTTLRRIDFAQLVTVLQFDL